MDVTYNYLGETELNIIQMNNHEFLKTFQNIIAKYVQVKVQGEYKGWGKTLVLGKRESY